MANIECWLGNCVIFQGIRTGIAKKTNSFAIFQAGGGGGSRPRLPSGSVHALVNWGKRNW